MSASRTPGLSSQTNCTQDCTADECASMAGPAGEEPMELSSDEENAPPPAIIISTAPLPANTLESALPNTPQTIARAPSLAAGSTEKARALSTARRHFQKTSCSMFVANLHPNVTEMLLAELFSYAGPVEDVFIPADPVSSKPRNFGFVEFFDESAVVYAQRLLDGVLVFQQPIRVKPALS